MSFLCQTPDTFSDNLPAATGRDQRLIFQFLEAAQTAAAELVKGVTEVLEGE